MIKVKSFKIKVKNYKKIAGAAIVAAILVFSFHPPVYGDEFVSSKELIDNAVLLEGKTVMYKGELVTAIMKRGESSWINLNDGNNAIGVWCKSDALDAVKFIGDYKHKGDILEIKGVFHRACPEHGGDLDIHAGNIRILKYGFMTKERVDRMKLKISAGMFLAAILLIAVFRKRL